MLNFSLPRLDNDPVLRDMLLPYCRFNESTIWEDPQGKHKILCLDASGEEIKNYFIKDKAQLAVHDPPYNFIAFEERGGSKFAEWCRKWIVNTYFALDDNSALYIWLGADQSEHFQPLPEFMIMMKETGFQSRSFLTMRNQRGYGTQKNWMAVRQELLYYIKGAPKFNISAEYTEIPKVLKGYYKVINGKETENLERSKSNNIRAGNVWIDIQQVFYRMEENINGCYAQKPVKAIERILAASSERKDLVIDFFSHSGTTLLVSEMMERRCITADIDPVFCEISLRRLEHFRKTKKRGWQNGNPFMEEISQDEKLRLYLSVD